ncbi:hypothetical protein CSX04_07653 [Burkholderia cepacia]|nr:hypothetical protein CSX04_07653 [Burkholderia cepacia]
MAHRMYMFNLQDIGPADTPCLNMVEWNYDFPTVLSPLLAVAPFLARNRCNDTGNDDGIYAEAEGGKVLMARLYAFLERHADRLIDDLDAFREAKRKILAFLGNRAVHRYFHLNGWDVFNLSAEPHVELARALLARIERDNATIERAIETDDPAVLDQCEGLAEEEVTSFRELINQDHYDYGWEPLTSIYYEQVEVFEQDGQMGVMAITGEVLVPPRYDEIGFDTWMEVAVVRQGDRYGHIDSRVKRLHRCSTSAYGRSGAGNMRGCCTTASSVWWIATGYRSSRAVMRRWPCCNIPAAGAGPPAKTSDGACSMPPRNGVCRPSTNQSTTRSAGSLRRVQATTCRTSLRVASRGSGHCRTIRSGHTRSNSARKARCFTMK